MKLTTWTEAYRELGRAGRAWLRARRSGAGDQTQQSAQQPARIAEDE